MPSLNDFHGPLLDSLCLSCTGEPSTEPLGYKRCPLVDIVGPKMSKGGRNCTQMSPLLTLTVRRFLARLRDGSRPWLLFLAVMKSWLGWLSEVENLMSHCLVEQCNFVWSCTNLPTYLGQRFIYGALWSDTVISFSSPHSLWCLLTTRFLFFFFSSLC